MRIYLDADGCPVVKQTLRIAAAHAVACTLLCDTAHRMEHPGVETIVVSTGADSVDFRLVNLLAKGDLVITQDYGLAAMCLARGARVLHQDGREYTNDNIEGLLAFRHDAKKVRMGGGRLKGLPKRTAQQDQQFCDALEALLTKEA